MKNVRLKKSRLMADNSKGHALGEAKDESELLLEAWQESQEVREGLTFAVNLEVISYPTTMQWIKG